MTIYKNRIEKMTYGEVMSIVESCWERLDTSSRQNVREGVLDKIKHYQDLNNWNERIWAVKGKYQVQLNHWQSVSEQINAL